jgi:hypothetical protein
MDQTTLFNELFSASGLKACFEARFIDSPTRGIDRISGYEFALMDDGVFDVMAEKIASGRYRFSPYTEKLVTKGRDKAPRMISIATVRDRIVLRQLNRFLQQVYHQRLPVSLPKRTIGWVIDLVSDMGQQDNWVYKGDIKCFYDEIPHSALMNTLSQDIVSSPARSLIEHALITPTVPKRTPRKHYYRFKPSVGVPQGLSISNTLANLYLEATDRTIKAQFPAVHYFRFVDDILIIGPRDQVVEAERWLQLEMNNLGLALHGDETKRHLKSLDEGFEFLGYVFKHGERSVRESSLSRLYVRLAKFVSQFNYAFGSTKPNNKDIDDFIERLNYRISGLVCSETQRHYGWLAYYHRITDLRVLFALDAYVADLLAHSKVFPHDRKEEVKSYVRSYFVTNHEMHKQNYIPSVWLGDNPQAQRAKLAALGLDIEDDFVYMDG